MAIKLGSITLGLDINITTPTGGPISIATAEVDVPTSTNATRVGATITIDEQVIRHEIAAVLMTTARELERDLTD